MAAESANSTILGTEKPMLIDFVLFNDLDQIFQTYTGFNSPGPGCPRLQGWYDMMKKNEALKEGSDKLKALIENHSLAMQRAEETQEQ